MLHGLWVLKAWIGIKAWMRVHDVWNTGTAVLMACIQAVKNRTALSVIWEVTGSAASVFSQSVLQKLAGYL